MDEGTPAGAAARRWIWIGLLAGLAVYAFFACRFWFLTDDAFISFRYAKNWADGLGLRYNLGVEPPVEGFSNFLWTALMALVRLLSGDMTAAAPWISFLCGAALAVMVFWHVRAGRGTAKGPAGRLEAGVAALLAVWFLALHPPFAVWSTGGLETMLFALLLFVAFERLLYGAASAGRGSAAGAAAALAALARPEGLIWGLSLFGLYVGERAFRRERLLDGRARAYAVVLVGVSAVFLAARLWYFERWLPNTAYAKVGLTSAVLERGALYAAHFCLTFVTPAVLFAALVVRLVRCGVRRAAGRAGADERGADEPVGAEAADWAAWRRAGFMAAGFAVYAAAAGGDFMAMGRFLAPAAPYFAILFARLGAPLLFCQGSRLPRAAAALALAGLLALQVLPAFNVDILPAPVREALSFRWNTEAHLSEYEKWASARENAEKWGAAGRALEGIASPGDSLLCSNIGAVGYYSELFIYDTCGLIDPDVGSRVLPPDGPPKSPGHDKELPLGHFFHFRPTFFKPVVIRAEEVIPADRLDLRGLPPGYEIRHMPLDAVEGAPPGYVLIVFRRTADA